MKPQSGHPEDIQKHPSMNEPISKLSVIKDLQWALQHIYDPVELSKSPIIQLLGLQKRHNPAAVLEQLIKESIQFLKPGNDVPINSNAWRIYYVLTRRYVMQFRQKQVATELGFSIRQMRRQEDMAVEALANYFIRKHDLALADHIEPAPPPTSQSASSEIRYESEFSQIEASFPVETVDVATVLSSALKNIAPLAQSGKTNLAMQISEDRPPVTIQVSPICQALTILLDAAIQLAKEILIDIEVSSAGDSVEVRIQADRAVGSDIAEPFGNENHELINRLIQMSKGTLIFYEKPADSPQFVAKITLPASRQIPVMMVDDNVDTLNMIKRFTAGTKYRLIGIKEPAQVTSFLTTNLPSAIIVDVMLPELDGWEILRQIRGSSKLQKIPIVICSILPHERVAITQGANAFLRKPFSREALLALLDRLELHIQPQEVRDFYSS